MAATLTIEWREADGHVLMTGPADTSFAGSDRPHCPRARGSLAA